METHLILTDEEITLIVRECTRGSATNRDGSTSHRIARAIESAVMAKLREQKPFAWACWLNNDTEQKPIDCRISTLEPTAYPIRRKLFIHPAPIPDGMALVPTKILDVFPEINQSNYNHDDVCTLNDWAIELTLAAARSE